MKHRILLFAFLTLAVLLPTTSWCREAVAVKSLPKVHIIATGGTIAGTSTDIGYDAGKVFCLQLLSNVPGEPLRRRVTLQKVPVPLRERLINEP